MTRASNSTNESRCSKDVRLKANVLVLVFGLLVFEVSSSRDMQDRRTPTIIFTNMSYKSER